MITASFKSVLENLAKNVAYDEPMSKHTTFKIGGLCDAFVSVSTVDEIVEVINLCKSESVRYTVVGNGSNLLVSDEGINGVVLCMGNGFNEVAVEDETIKAQSGALLSKIANVALENSLSGMEFAAGIPASLGGAVYMNAGAYDGEMRYVVVSTTYIDEDASIKTIYGKEHCFSYRNSIFHDRNVLIISSELRLEKGNYEVIKAKMQELSQKRRLKQPLDMPSAGSAFKRPVDNYAAQLIDMAGLKGKKIGGAMVSDKHSGFIVNVGDATCCDVIKLIDYVKECVYKKFGILLEQEVKFLGNNYSCLNYDVLNKN